MADQLEYIRDYLLATTESSVRSRRILVLLLVASILIFITFWNSRDSSWILTHVKWAEEIETSFRKLQSGGQPSSDMDVRIQARASDYHIESVEDAQHFHQHLLDLMAEHVLYVRVPVLGVAFDINDLGVLSGITLTVLLLWSRFALWHEQRNLQLCMAESKAEDRKAVYRYLAMRQLLTIPPKLADPNSARIWGWLVLILFCLPGLVYGFVVGYDLLFSGGLPDTSGLAIDLIGEFLCLVVVMTLTFLCVQLLRDIHASWDYFAQDVRSPVNQQVAGSA